MSSISFYWHMNQCSDMRLRGYQRKQVLYPMPLSLTQPLVPIAWTSSESQFHYRRSLTTSILSNAQCAGG